MSKENELIEPSHIGDGLYFLDRYTSIDIAVNHHTNAVACLNIADLDKAIEYLNKVRKRINNK